MWVCLDNWDAIVMFAVSFFCSGELIEYPRGQSDVGFAYLHPCDETLRPYLFRDQEDKARSRFCKYHQDRVRFPILISWLE